MQDFLALANKSIKPRVLHTEEHFEVKVGSATVAGRIDRIDDLGNGRVAIVDYKTGKPRAQEDADESLQLSIYAMAAREKWGYESERLVFTTSRKTAPSPLGAIRCNWKARVPRSKMSRIRLRPATSIHARVSLPLLFVPQFVSRYREALAQRTAQAARCQQLIRSRTKNFGGRFWRPRICC